MPRLGAVLLAAGCSSRFGRDNKLLAKIDGRPMVRAVAEALLGVGCIDEVLVVTGHDAPSLEQALKRLPVRFVFNPDWGDGIGGSIALGVSRLDAALDGAAIVPGDMPFLTARVIERLATKFQERNGESIAYPVTSAGEQRNPVVWPRRFFVLLEGLSGPEGGKKLLSELSDRCSAVVVTEEWELLDVDVPEDM